MLAYYVLYRRGSRLEYNEAIEEVSSKLCVPRRVSRRILKRLRNTGYVRIEKRYNSVSVYVRDINEVFNELLGDYSGKRCSRIEDKKSLAPHIS